jgi:glucans biosynthesis protein C
MLTDSPAAPVTSQSARRASERRYDLDWLRIIAILLLLFYHSGMAFVAEWGWHLKNAETSAIFQEWMYFLSRWRMALLFFISGAGTWFVLKRATAGEYLWRRVLRLLIPLIFGMLVVVPPQIYMERLAQGANFGSYLDFYSSVFDLEPYPKGNTSWHHLWFVAYLFIYSILGLPIFIFLRSDRGQSLVQRLADRLSLPLVYAFGLPMAIIYAGLYVKFRGPQDIVHDWAMLLYYFSYFVVGFSFTLDSRFSNLLEEKRQTSLGLGCLAYLIISYLRWNDKEPAFSYSVPNMFFLALISFNAWFWVLTILGYGKRYLNRSGALLNYANEAIYPFYILHQTVIVIIVYYVIRTNDSILLKFLFTSLASFLVTMVIYHFAVRPFGPLRFVFGMKYER